MKTLFYKSKNFKNLEVEVCQTELKEFALGAENFKNLEELDVVNFPNCNHPG